MKEHERSLLFSTSCDLSNKDNNQCRNENEIVNDEEDQWKDPSKEQWKWWMSLVEPLDHEERK